MHEKFDVVVVGAGPAGCSAAYALAREGLEVLVIERGSAVGAKNMTGGVLYGPVLEKIFPDFPSGVPVERAINRHAISFLSTDSSVSFDVRLGDSRHAAYSVLRAKFDRWFAEKVEEAGGIVAAGLLVEDLVIQDGKVAGVIAGGDEFRSSVVLAADGANSLMAEKAGLGTKLAPGNMNQGVKEVIRLPREVIEERFGLEGDGGAAIHYLGACTRGIHGGGFLYTNKDSISLGVVVQLQALMDSGLRATDLLDGFKAHPAVRDLIRSGEVVEYSAHLVPAGGLGMVPRLCTDGMLVAGDAAGLVLATGRALEGLNFAIASGLAAAEAIKKARETDDFSRSVLAVYETLLRDSFVMQDLDTFKSAASFLDNPRLYEAYPEFICRMGEKIFESNGDPKSRAWDVVRREMKGRMGVWDLLRDAWAARRSL